MQEAFDVCEGQRELPASGILKQGVTELWRWCCGQQLMPMAFLVVRTASQNLNVNDLTMRPTSCGGDCLPEVSKKSIRPTGAPS